MNGESENKSQFGVAGFWRRGFAFAIDVAIVSIPFGILGFLFTDIAVQLGPCGHTVTFIALVIYFSILDSQIGRGQSFGKKITKIRVIHRDGSYLTLRQSATRALLVIPIGMFNGWAIPISGSVYAFISSSIFLGGGLALAYAYIFNRKTRQCIHDLATGAYVVRGEFKDGALEDTTSLHKGITYSLLVFGIVATGVLTFVVSPGKFINMPAFEQMTNFRETLLQEEGVYDAGVSFRNYSRVIGSEDSEAYSELNLILRVNKSCEKNKDYCTTLLNDVATKALLEYQGIDDYDYLRVEVHYGFDLGLAQGTYRFGDNKSIDEWRTELNITSSTQ